jgi:hypothetical protein
MRAGFSTRPHSRRFASWLLVLSLLGAAWAVNYEEAQITESLPQESYPGQFVYMGGQWVESDQGSYRP